MLELIDSWFNWMPEQASTFAPKVDFINNFITYVSVFCILAISGAMVYYGFRYNRKKTKETAYITHNAALETVWTAIPTVICIYVFWVGFDAYREMREVPANPIEINVVGTEGWKWIFTYPTGKVDKDLYVPIDKPVRLIMKAERQSHSLFIPTMRVKEDVIASQYNYLWFQPTKLSPPEGYHIFCTEYCGDQHSEMLARLHVVSSEEYEDFINDRSAVELTPAERGKKVYELHCSACHSLDGSRVVGPSFKGLWGGNERVKDSKDGEAYEVMVDENYVRESILYPQKKLVEGYEAAYMQSFQGILTDEEIQHVITWMKTLSEEVE